MKRFVQPSIGLIGQIVAILLLTMVIEFGISTLLYERASQFSVRDDEARRLAEHLVIARRLVAEQPPTRRGDMANDLTTERYALHWQRDLPPPPPIAPALDSMRHQVVDWEPTLATADLRLKLTSPGRSSVVTGGLKLSDGSWLYFRTLEPLQNLNLAAERILLALIPALALMVIGGLLIRRMLRPMRQLAFAADTFGDAEHDPIPETGPREVRHVVAAFNRMAARIQRLIADRTQALAAVGHDLRTPLTRLRNGAEAALRTERDPERQREALEKVIGEADGLIAVFNALLMIARAEAGAGRDALVVGDVGAVVSEVVELYEPSAEDEGAGLRAEIEPGIAVLLNRELLGQALANLVDNALKYGLPPDGAAAEVAVSVRRAGDRVAITVADRGAGIPAEDRGRVLDRFVRLEGSRSRPGSGLGLSLATAIARLHGGELSLGDNGPGLRVTMSLPVAPDAARRLPAGDGAAKDR